MSFSRVPGAGSTGFPQTPSPAGGSGSLGRGANTQAARPVGLSARPTLARSQSLPPRAKLPGGSASGGPGSLAQASPGHVESEPMHAPDRARTYEHYMSQLSGLIVDPPVAQGSAGSAARSEKPVGGSSLPAAAGGRAKSSDPFDWSSKLFPAGGDALPTAATPGIGARSEGRPYELPPNPFDTSGDPRPSSPATKDGPRPAAKAAANLPRNTFFTIDPPDPAATPLGINPEKLRIDMSVTAEPARPNPEGSTGNAATTARPATGSSLPASTGGGAKAGDPFDWSRKLFPAGGDAPPSSAAAGTGAKSEGRPYELPSNPFVTDGGPRPSSQASEGGGKPPGKPSAELPLNTFFTLDPPPAAPSGGSPEKVKLNTSVTIEPAGKTQGSSTGDAAAPGKPATDPPPGEPATPAGAKLDKPAKVHVGASVDVESPAAGAGGPAVPPRSPAVLTEMQQLQETQRQGMQQQADMQKMAIENQVLTARLKLEMDLTTAITDFIKKQGEGVKHAAAG